MKSPTSSVGRIDDDGILNGSATNERSKKTISRTGKKPFGYSIHHGSRASAERPRARNQRSASATAPVATVARNRISGKFIVIVGAGLEIVPYVFDYGLACAAGSAAAVMRSR